ncbi:Immediate early response 3-interacting protein 1 [Larimichthys crocea]|uniref:Immediate early response 3-interacting protein 1 n=1 Tax=Larimichthys crocea TaxID=215358 RepID=A0A6G0IJD0_LARCR|nr:Immediate early response 3-interacting protein 1 [Larimichthys crocea]
MAFTLYSLIQAAILCVNAVAVLHEERFLSKIGWGVDQSVGGFGDEPGIKVQLMNLVRSVRTVMRVPLIAVNSLLKTNVLNNDRLPSFVYLYIKYLSRAVTRRTGCLYTAAANSDVVYTVLNCRLETSLLRRLLLMVLTDEKFRLSPAGLVRVRQSMKTLQPVDELKRGPFMLRVQVVEYRQIDTGMEVDVCLSATSHTSCPVWESVLTLLSKNRLHKARRCLPGKENESQPDDPVPENVKQVEFRVPSTIDLQCVGAFSDFSPCHILSVLARLCGCRSQTAPSLWMLSVCLAEIEKHKGVGVITAPVNITVQFMEPLLVPGRVTIKFWEMTKNWGSSSVQVYHDYQKVAFKMYSGNGHATENGSHIRRDQVTSRDGTGKMSSVPDVISNSRDQRYNINDETVQRNSAWMMDSSSQAYSGAEDDSTDPHETMTETSTLTFVDAHTMEESVEDHSLHRVEMVYLKEFAMIDDDDDGDMSLREKTVTDLSVMNGKAAALVCERLMSTSSGSVSECKEESPAPEAPSPEEVEDT